MNVSSQQPLTTTKSAAEIAMPLMPDALRRRWWADHAFLAGLVVLGGFYVLMICLLLAADVQYAARHTEKVWQTLRTAEIRYAIWLSLVSCCVTTILSLWVAVPLGYLLSRAKFRGKVLLDCLLDVPIFLPPLVVGLSLLILFRQTPLRVLDDRWQIAFHIPAVILAQFSVASAFAVRTLQATFDGISPRLEQVAWTLGCSRAKAFTAIVLPQAWRGILTAATLAWARSLGEFGPVLVFAGSTRRRTEVLPVSVHMELSIGNLEGAVGVSLLMVVMALTVLVIVRLLGGRRLSW